MTFYKYTSISTAKLLIKNRTIRWSSPVIFNDIEECQFVPSTQERMVAAQRQYQEILTECAKGNFTSNYESYSYVTKQITSLLKISMDLGKFSSVDLERTIRKVTSNFDDDFRTYVNVALMKCLRLLCVTEDFDNVLMWAHYADQHRGCVLELDKFFCDEPRGLREGCVRYHENLEPKSNPLDILLFGQTKEVTERLTEDVIFSKRTVWNYEKEYRFFFYESFGEITMQVDLATNGRKITVKDQAESLYTDVPFPLDAIKSITFGARTPKEEIEQLVEMLGGEGIAFNVYQMQMRDGNVVRTDFV